MFPAKNNDVVGILKVSDAAICICSIATWRDAQDWKPEEYVEKIIDKPMLSTLFRIFVGVAIITPITISIEGDILV